MQIKPNSFKTIMIPLALTTQLTSLKKGTAGGFSSFSFFFFPFLPLSPLNKTKKKGFVLTIFHAYNYLPISILILITGSRTQEIGMDTLCSALTTNP